MIEPAIGNPRGAGQRDEVASQVLAQQRSPLGVVDCVHDAGDQPGRVFDLAFGVRDRQPRVHAVDHREQPVGQLSRDVVLDVGTHGSTPRWHADTFPT
jgi:hypothetical protein